MLSLRSVTTEVNLSLNSEIGVNGSEIWVLANIANEININVNRDDLCMYLVTYQIYKSKRIKQELINRSVCYCFINTVIVRLKR